MHNGHQNEWHRCWTGVADVLMRKHSLSTRNEINGTRCMTERKGQPKSTKETRKILSREGNITHEE